MYNRNTMSDTVRTLGLVKWFNNKVGYGFITELEGDKREIFVHYSAITTTDSQYKYLVQGEYVEFDLDKSTNDKHEFHAINISGIKGGPIMCETRRLSRENGENVDGDQEVDVKPLRRRPTTSTNPRRPPRRQTDSQPPDAEGEFTTVEKKVRKRPVQKSVPKSE